MQLEVPGKDITILPSLLNQTYEAFELKLLELLLRPGATFIDVGANIGIYTAIAASLIGPAGIAYGFEPVSENFEILKRNLDNNHLKNVVTEQIAIGNRVAKSVLYLDDNSIGTHSLLRRRPSYRQDQEVDVLVTTLDAYFSKEMPTVVDLLKIDVEGYESFVLEGATALLLRTNKILIEYNRLEIESSYGIAQFIHLLADFPYLYGINERSKTLSRFSRSDFFSQTYLNLLVSKTEM
jgi:FkbM family methyltransferase